jgi:ribose 5-phosphate isomerase B
MAVESSRGEPVDFFGPRRDASLKIPSGFVSARGQRKTMPDTGTVLPKTPRRIGIAADHGGFELKEYLSGMLRESNYDVRDFGDSELKSADDYPDFIVPLARAVARGEVDRGIAICGSGVGACIASNKVPGVRACLINDFLSAHQGVEDDDMNVICLGGRVVTKADAWEWVRLFLESRFSGAERHRRRVAEVESLENTEPVL